MTLTVANIGDAPLVVVSLAFDASPELTLDTPPLPASLVAGASLEITVHYTPTDELVDEADLVIVSSEGEAVVPITGGTQPTTVGFDEFLQSGNRTVDILWMVDSSCSMAYEQQALGANFGTFLGIVDGLGLDYRIGVVTADMDDDGELQGDVPFVTNTTPEAHDTFEDNVLVGQLGSGSERGLDSIREALVEGAAGSFLRDDAQLRLISVSDEDDQSLLQPTVAHFVAELQALKPNPAHVVYSDITGGEDGCVSDNANADSAERYLEATALSGGISTSICDTNWIDTLTDLAVLADSYADTFELSQDAVGSTVAVQINSAPVVTGWGFDEELNAVVFAPDAVPADGSLLRVDYVIAQPCED
ncbi:MAG: hypothetical protein GY898_15275 [Proteobacteria bacterium]|nr:hypothetical protein [Pseudomonadota bacterium]